jgi:hypothetical protein
METVRRMQQVKITIDIVYLTIPMKKHAQFAVTLAETCAPA